MSIFADTDQTRAWEAHLRTQTAPARPVPLPEGNALIDALQFLAIPDEDIADIVALATRLRSGSPLWWYLERAVWSLASHIGDIDAPPRFAALNDINDPKYRYFYVLVCVGALPYVREYHQSKGIPDAISQATLVDLGRNVRVHRKREGIGGLGVAWWLMLHFRGVIYQLGRLQFEQVWLGDNIAASIQADGGDASPGSPALSIHIPDFSGPMTPAACDESIALARDFFPTYFPETRYDNAICSSWLLDPQLKQYLRPESNIIRFQDRFNLVEGGWESNMSIMQFVFGKTPEHLNTVPRTTSLERAVVEHLSAGGIWYGRAGWFQLSDT